MTSVPFLISCSSPQQSSAADAPTPGPGSRGPASPLRVLFRSPFLAGETKRRPCPVPIPPPILPLPARKEPSLPEQSHPSKELVCDSQPGSCAFGQLLLLASTVLPGRELTLSCFPAAVPEDFAPGLKPSPLSHCHCAVWAPPWGWGPATARKLPVPGWLRHSICAGICSLPAVYPLPSS